MLLGGMEVMVLNTLKAAGKAERCLGLAGNALITINV